MLHSTHLICGNCCTMDACISLHSNVANPKSAIGIQGRVFIDVLSLVRCSISHFHCHLCVGVYIYILINNTCIAMNGLYIYIYLYVYIYIYIYIFIFIATLA